MHMYFSKVSSIVNLYRKDTRALARAQTQKKLQKISQRLALVRKLGDRSAADDLEGVDWASSSEKIHKKCEVDRFGAHCF